MSVTIDTINRLVSLNGGVGDTQGAYYAFASPLANPIGIRVAYRIYFDTFSNTSISPWSTNTLSNYRNFYYNSATWDGSTCVGLSYETTFPALLGGTGFGPIKNFLGIRTGGKSDNSTDVSRAALVHSTTANSLLGNLGAVCILGGYVNSSAYGTHKAFYGKPVKTGGTGNSQLIDSHNGDLDWLDSKYAGLYNIPANPTEGAKWTVGIEIRKSADFTVSQTTFYNTNSLSEANLLNVFTSYDDFLPAFTVSLSTTTRDSNDAFYPTSDAFVPPPYFMFRWGGPSQKLIVSALRYQYLY